LLTVQNHAHILDETVDDLESPRCGSPSHILRESVQPLQDCLEFLLHEEFLYKFYCVAMRVWYYVSEYALTRFSSLKLFCCRTQYGEYFRDDFDQYIDHWGRKRDPRIYVETVDE
jgi:hypothetical protein